MNRIKNAWTFGVLVLTLVLCSRAVEAQTGPSATPPAMPPGTATPAASDALPRLMITAALLAGLPRRDVTVQEEKLGTVVYSGVDLGLLLAKSGAPHGALLHGAAAADYVVVRAADGYRATFALAELDAAVTEKVVILADRRNGQPLAADIGPFRIVVPDEKRHVRWIHNVVAVDVLDVR